MATYEERRAAQQDRLDGRADRLAAERDARYQAARAAIEHIPPGQPILVDHYSARRHRADLAKHDTNMRKACEAADAMKHIPTSATTAVLASDDDATDKLAERIAQAEAAHVKMKAANVLIRRGDIDGLVTLGFTEDRARSLLLPDSMGCIGFPSYAMTSNSANIRRMKERLAHLTKVKAAPAVERTVNGVRVEEDPEAVRLRLHFQGKPAPAVIAELKARGFRWAPSEGAWQRQLSNAARHAAEQILLLIAK